MEIIVNSCIIGNSFVANWPIVVWWKRLRFVRPVIQFDTSSTTLLNVMMFVFLDWNWRIRYPVEQSVRWYWYGGKAKKNDCHEQDTHFSQRHLTDFNLLEFVLSKHTFFLFKWRDNVIVTVLYKTTQWCQLHVLILFQFAAFQNA